MGGTCPEFVVQKEEQRGGGANTVAVLVLIKVSLDSRAEGSIANATYRGTSLREIGNLLPNNRRQRRTCYALCHILYPVSAAHTSIFRMDSNSTSYKGGVRSLQGYLAHKNPPPPLGPP